MFLREQHITHEPITIGYNESGAVACNLLICDAEMVLLVSRLQDSGMCQQWQQID